MCEYSNIYNNQITHFLRIYFIEFLGSDFKVHTNTHAHTHSLRGFLE